VLRVWRKGNPCVDCGIVNWYTHLANSMRFFKTLRIELPYDPVVSFGYISKGTEISKLKGYLYSHVNCSIIHNSQDFEITLASINR
jgi:hypothetical protein